MTTQHLTNCLWQFQQIYNFGAVETKMKHFEVKRWRSQRDRVRSNRPKYFGGHFLTCLWNRWSLPLSHLCYLSCLVVVCQLVFTWIWMNPVTHYIVHMIPMMYVSEVKVTNKIFKNMHFSFRIIPVDGSLSKNV